MRLTLYFVALVAWSVFGGFAAEPEPTSLCEVLNRPEQYTGKHVLVHGIVEESEHGNYLKASPKCKQGESAIEIEGFDIAAYYAAGGKKYQGILAMVDGKIVMSDRRRFTLPQRPNEVPAPPKPHAAFSASKVSYEPSRSSSK